MDNKIAFNIVKRFYIKWESIYIYIKNWLLLFSIQYSFKLWKYVKLHIKRKNVKRSFRRSGNSQLSCISIINWLLIWHWQSVEESDFGIDWHKNWVCLWINMSVTIWNLQIPPSLKYSCFQTTILRIRVRSWSLKL